MAADGTSPHPRAPVEPRPITGALARQFEPKQLAINRAGLRSIMRGLGGPITEPLPAQRGAHPMPGALYVGERAWCCGLYDPLFDGAWDRAPDEVSHERAPCARVAILDVPERASCA